MEHNLLYELEYKANELRETRLNEIKYSEMSIKDLLDLGFDNSFIEIKGQWYNLGYKWYIGDNFGYESSNFGELNKEQLNCIVKYVDDEISDYNYQQVSVELVNEENSKYFLGDAENEN